MGTNTTCPDNTDDRRGTSVGFKEIKHLTAHERQNLRQYTEAIAVQSVAPGRYNAFHWLLVRAFNGFGKQLPECTEIRAGNCKNASERSKAYHRYPYQCPDQCIDAANGIEKATNAEVEKDIRNNVLRSQKTEWERKKRGQQCAKIRDR